MNGLTLRIMGDAPGSVLEIPLAPGDAGTEQTISVMRTMAHEFTKSRWVKAVAAKLRADVYKRVRDLALGVGAQHGLIQSAELDALFAWFKERIAFCKDPAGIELVRRPDHQIRAMQGGRQACGDCDDASVLGAALLLVLGYSPVFVTISRDQGAYAHVYWGIYAGPGTYIAMDPQHFNAPGEEAQDVARRRVWRV